MRVTETETDTDGTWGKLETGEWYCITTDPVVGAMVSAYVSHCAPVPFRKIDQVCDAAWSMINDREG